MDLFKPSPEKILADNTQLARDKLFGPGRGGGMLRSLTAYAEGSGTSMPCDRADQEGVPRGVIAQEAGRELTNSGQAKLSDQAVLRVVKNKCTLTM